MPAAGSGKIARNRTVSAMARPLRLHIPGAMYHVTLRGNHRQDIFFARADRELMNALFANVLERCDARLHAYCYMTNHIHAVIQVSDIPLGRVIMRLAGTYARTVQARFETTGHLFEKRYHPVLVDADSYLLELLRYLHLNPVTAGLATSPDDYTWSSHHAYMGFRDEPWVTTDFALSLLSKERTRAIRAYKGFIELALRAKNFASPLDQPNPGDRRVLGDDDFARRTLGVHWKPRSRKSLDDLIAEACKHFLVTETLLQSNSRKEVLVEARAWVAQQAITESIAPLTAVARRFNRDESTLRYLLSSRFRKP
jgi:putative transposase